MIGRTKPPSVAELTAWLEEEMQACRFNYASSMADPERASFWARRQGYLEATAEVIGWFQSELAEKRT